jgi:hypothetical protein
MAVAASPLAIGCAVIASEAKQSRVMDEKESGLLRRDVPRNDES